MSRSCPNCVRPRAEYVDARCEWSHEDVACSHRVTGCRCDSESSHFNCECGLKPKPGNYKQHCGSYQEYGPPSPSITVAIGINVFGIVPSLFQSRDIGLRDLQLLCHARTFVLLLLWIVVGAPLGREWCPSLTFIWFVSSPFLTFSSRFLSTPVPLMPFVGDFLFVSWLRRL